MPRQTPLLRSSSHADRGTTAANSITVPTPSSVLTGDVLFAYLNSSSGGNGTGWSLSGWTNIGPSFQSGSRAWGWFYHIVSDASAEPSSYTFTYTGTAGRVVASMFAYAKVDLTSIATAGGTTTYSDASDIQSGIPGWIRTKAFTTSAGATVLYANANNIAASYASAPTATPSGYTELVLQATAGDSTIVRTLHWIGTKIASTTNEPSARVDWSYVAASSAAHAISFLGAVTAAFPLKLGTATSIAALHAGTTNILRLYRGEAQLWPEPSAPATNYVTNIDAYGDSLTAGFGIGASNSWPAQLDGLLSTSTVQNFGVSGHTAAEISIRQGGLPLTLTFPSDTIPASGSVTVTASPAVAWGVTNFSTAGTVAGVAGTLTHAASQSGLNKTSWTFTRSTTGTAQSLGGSAQFRSTAIHDQPIIILAGRNDIGQGSDNAVAVQRVLDGYQQMIQYNTSGKHLVLSNTTTTNETATGMSRISSINSALSSTYGSNYLDVNGWLINNGLQALGITPTTEDSANIAAGKLPPSLMIDTIHWSTPTAGLVAQLIKERITALGWVPPTT